MNTDFTDSHGFSRLSISQSVGLSEMHWNSRKVREGVINQTFKLGVRLKVAPREFKRTRSTLTTAFLSHPTHLQFV